MEFVQSTPAADPLSVGRDLEASPEPVFFAWTNAEEVMQWFGHKPNSLHSASIDLREGGAWRFVESGDEQQRSYFEGRYLKIVNNALLLFTWSRVSHRTDGSLHTSSASQVEVNFTAHKRGTQLRLIHSAIHDDPTRYGFCHGWERAFTNWGQCFNAR